MTGPLVQAQAGLFGGSLYTFSTLPSTNRHVLDHLGDYGHGDTVFALSQISGRGRFERTWHAPEGKSLAFSTVLVPDQLPGAHIELMGTATALAIMDTLHEQGIPARVKWPNDVLARERKISGILIERRSPSSPLVVGVGLNVNTDANDWQGIELRTPATSLLEESGQTQDIGSVLKSLLRCMGDRVDMLSSTGGRDRLIADWQAHDSLKGKQVRVDAPSESVTGLYAGITIDGRLLLNLPGGRTETVHAGDVSVQDSGKPYSPTST